jgi:hypothetical protein
VDGRQRAVVSGVHRLQHVYALAAAHLADDDAVGTHTQRVLDEIALRHFAAPFDVGRARFESDDVRLLQLQLRRVFNRDDALIFGDVSRERVEKRRLACARAAGDQNIEPGVDAHLKHLCDVFRDRAEFDRARAAG